MIVNLVQILLHIYLGWNNQMNLKYQEVNCFVHKCPLLQQDVVVISRIPLNSPQVTQQINFILQNQGCLIHMLEYKIAQDLTKLFLNTRNIYLWLNISKLTFNVLDYATLFQFTSLLILIEVLLLIPKDVKNRFKISLRNMEHISSHQLLRLVLYSFQDFSSLSFCVAQGDIERVKTVVIIKALNENFIK